MSSERQSLFDYWKNINLFIFKEITKEKYFSHPVRREIIALLRKGIKEKSPDGTFDIRYALNVREISEKLKSDKNKTFGTTALYFHLDTLLELDLIKVVAILHDGPYGRNKTKYYGRTAKHLILSNIDVQRDNYKRQFDEFQKFADHIGLELPKGFSEKAKQFNNIKQSYNQILGKWLVDNEKIIEEERLDLNLLFEFLNNVNSIHPNYTLLLSDLFEILQSNIKEL